MYRKQAIWENEHESVSVRMTDVRRMTPHAEWVEMYRRGILPSRIASLCGAPVTTVRWDLALRRKAEDEARWQKRLQQVKGLRDAGGDWPRHQKTQDADERVLGVWLHGQRINYNQGNLATEKESLLNEVLPGWREGRRRTGSRRRTLQSPGDR